MALFIGANGLCIDQGKLGDLKKVDEQLNNNGWSDYKKFRISVVAIVGEFIIHAFDPETASWKYLNFNNVVARREPIIMINDRTLINPATIVNEEYNKKIKNSQYKISLYRCVKKLIGKNSGNLTM